MKAILILFISFLIPLIAVFQEDIDLSGVMKLTAEQLIKENGVMTLVVVVALIMNLNIILPDGKMPIFLEVSST